MKSVYKKFKSNKRKEKYLFVLINNINLTSNHSNLKLVEEHLKSAKEKNARILLGGNTLNFFKINKNFAIRKNQKEEFNQKLSLDFAYEFLKPYANNIEFITYKNSDLIELLPLRKLVNKLNYNLDCDIELSKEKNWFTAHFHMNNSSYKYNIFFNEGKTKSPVTKGKIQHSRLAEKIDGADAIWLYGQNNDYEHTRIIETLNSKNEITHKEILELRTPSYYKKSVINSKDKIIESIGGRWLEIELYRSDKYGILMKHKSYKI